MKVMKSKHIAAKRIMVVLAVFAGALFPLAPSVARSRHSSSSFGTSFSRSYTSYSSVSRFSSASSSFPSSATSGTESSESIEEAAETVGSEPEQVPEAVPDSDPEQNPVEGADSSSDSDPVPTPSPEPDPIAESEPTPIGDSPAEVSVTEPEPIEDRETEPPIEIPVTETPNNTAPDSVSEPEPESTTETEPTPDPVGDNLIANASFEAGSGDIPAGWATGSWGTHDAVFAYPVAGHAGSRAARVAITSHTDGDAKWYFDDVAVSPGATYAFSDRYRSDVATDVSARYTMTDGTENYVWLGTAPASSAWKEFASVFTVPVGAVSMTVFHVLAAPGFLITDDYSLESHAVVPVSGGGMISFTFDDGFTNTYEALPILEAAGIRSTQAIITEALGWDGYVTAAQVRDMAARGHEIASHSRTHAHLTTLSASRLASEVAGSKSDLATLGISTDIFVYPYGEYDQTVIDAVRSAGYTGARSVDEGYDDATTDPYAIRDQHITSDITFETVKGWIDTTAESGQWLVLEMHQQTTDPGVQYGNDPELLRQIVEYVVARNMKTVTLGEGIATLGLR